MRRFIYSIFISSLLFPICFGQIPLKPNEKTTETCNLSLANAPVLRGFKLGMSVSEAQNIFPKDYPLTFSLLKVEIDAGNQIIKTERMKTFDLKTNLSLRNIAKPNVEQDRISDYPMPEFLEGIGNVRLIFCEEKVCGIQLDYLNNNLWKNTDEFIDNFSEKHELPRNAWLNLSDSQKALRCQDFRMLADGVSMIKISLTNNQYHELIDSIRRNRKEKQTLNQNK